MMARKRKADAAARAFFAQHAPAGEVARMRAAMRRHDYEVVVGNVGTVYRGRSTKKAMKIFAEYVEIAKLGAPDGHAGRASGEDVTLFRDGDVYKEHVGFLSRNDEGDEDHSYDCDYVHGVGPCDCGQA